MHGKEFTKLEFGYFVEAFNVYRCKISSIHLFLFLHLNLTLAAWIDYIVVAVTTRLTLYSMKLVATYRNYSNRTVDPI